MNLIHGKIMNAKESQEVLDHLQEHILTTLGSTRLDPWTVLNACDRLVGTMEEETYLQEMMQLGIEEATGQEYLREAKVMFSREYLQARLDAELGGAGFEERRYTPPFSSGEVWERIMPIGVLLHIAAGNMEGLPAFSVLEGLLTGNINILKLPEADGGISIRLLLELIRIEPGLAEYIYVFDYSSKDKQSISKLIDAADALVVWGGDAAVTAMRQMAGPKLKLIEWGHKLSFAYVTEQGISDEALRGVAWNICRTNQLLCSSCQGIFLDTEDMTAVYRFCERFLPILEEESQKMHPNDSIGIVSQITLELYNEELEGCYCGSRIYRGKTCSIIAYHDSELALSLQFRNLWVKPLSRGKLLEHLRPHKCHLQTAALLCGEGERSELLNCLAKTGVVRITDGSKMSATYCGGAHDGEYSLRRYTKIVSVE